MFHRVQKHDERTWLFVFPLALLNVKEDLKCRFDRPGIVVFEAMLVDHGQSDQCTRVRTDHHDVTGDDLSGILTAASQEPPMGDNNRGGFLHRLVRSKEELPSDFAPLERFTSHCRSLSAAFLPPPTTLRKAGRICSSVAHTRTQQRQQPFHQA